MEGTQMTPDLQALKTRLRATWIAGDFGEIAKSYAPGAEEFVQSLNLQPGMRVLDVASGTGNLALPAARLGAVVTGVDIAPNLVEQARENAKREGLTAQFDEGDAENSALRGWEFRCGDHDVWGDVRSASGARCGGAQARHAARRRYRDGQLDTDRVYRADVQDHVLARAAAGGHAVARFVGL